MDQELAVIVRDHCFVPITIKSFSNLVILFVLAIVHNGYAQGALTNCPGDFEIPEDQKVLKSVKLMPTWPGCEDIVKSGKRNSCTSKLVAEFIREGQPKDMALGGDVFISFIIEENGCISNILVDDPQGIREEWIAQEIIRSMPAWIPGMDKNGNLQRIEMKLPVRFGQ